MGRSCSQRKTIEKEVTMSKAAVKSFLIWNHLTAVCCDYIHDFVI